MNSCGNYRVLVHLYNSFGEIDWVMQNLYQINSLKSIQVDFFVSSSKLHKKLMNSEYYSLLDRGRILKLNSVLSLFDQKIEYIVRRYKNDFVKNILYLLINFMSGLTKINFLSYDAIFVDSNLKHGIFLDKLLRSNFNGKFFVYPHSFGKVSFGDLATIKEIKDCAFLFNSHVDKLNWIMSSGYSEKRCYVAGGITVRPEKFDNESTDILLLTRDAFTVEYGFSRQAAINQFRRVVIELEKCGYRIFFRHHPRDNRQDEWSKGTEKYIEEFTSSRNSRHSFRAVLSMYSTAIIPYISKRVPVFDISPYDAGINADFPRHRKVGDKLISDLSDAGLVEQLDDLENLVQIILSDDELRTISRKQRRSFKSYIGKYDFLSLEDLLELSFVE